MSKININVKNQTGGINVGQVNSYPSHNSQNLAPKDQLINKYFPVLDHGFVAVSEVMGSDESIEKAARTSYGGGTRKVSQTRGLLRYLIRNKHTSPLEFAEIKFHVACPIFVMNQWHRHRASNFNTMSGRYSLMPMLFYTPEKDHFQKQSQNNKQGRAGNLGEDKYKVAIERWKELRENSQSLYEDLAGENIARELARIDLPLSMYSVMYYKSDLHNLFHFLNLRTDPHAQYEIRAYANVMAAMVKQIFPLSYEAWYDYQKCGVSFSRMEMDLMRILLRDPDGNKILMDIHGEDVEKRNKITSEYGLSKREMEEFMVKLTHQNPPKFELDFSQAKSPEYFEEKMKNAVPIIDQNG